MNKKRENKPLSKEEESLKSYNAKLRGEAIFKSLVLGLLGGFLLSAIVSIISFATLSNILWVALVVWAVSTAGFTVLLYYKRYRPNVKTIAERVDEVGLEERVITMMQFKDQDNPMLNRQRADAQEKLETVSVKQVKFRFSKVLVIALAVLAAAAIFMMSYSTVLAVNAEDIEEPPVEEELSEEDKIIRDLLEALREEIDNAKISDELRNQLHKMVDDLEASLKPTDSLEVKVAKIMDTADKIHKLIEDYLNRITIGEELMKHDTTYVLGEAIDSWDIDKIRAAFEMMYDQIEPLVERAAFDILHQTAMDIDQALKDAINTPPELQKALEDLRDAYLRVFKDLEDQLKDQLEEMFPEEDFEEMTPEDMDEFLDQMTPEQMEDLLDQMEDQIQDALDQIQDAFDQFESAMEDFFNEMQQEDQAMEDLDDALQDIFQDAMDQLGQEFEYPENAEDPEENNQGNLPEEELPDDGEMPDDGDIEGGSQAPNNSDDTTQDTVIDGQTSYKDVFDDGYADDIQDKLESGELSDEDRQTMQDYLDTLK